MTPLALIAGALVPTSRLGSPGANLRPSPLGTSE
jgi:hypothetical protein